MDTPVGLPLSYCPPACRIFSPLIVPSRLRGEGGAIAPKGGGPAGPAGCIEGLCRKVRRKGSKGSEGSKGKVDGAFGPEGCIEGLCPQRGNDSLHFARRFAPSSTAVTDSLDFQVADAPLQIQFASAKCVRWASLRSGGDSPMGLKVVDCPLGNDYEVSVTGLAFVSL